MQLSATTNTAAALREELQLAEQLERELNAVDGAISRSQNRAGQGGGAVITTDDPDFARQFDRNVEKLRSAATARTRGETISARQAGHMMMGPVELLQGNISLRNIRETAEAAQAVTGKAGKIASLAAAAEGLAVTLGPAVFLAHAVKEGYNSLLDHFNADAQKQFKSLEDSEAAYRRLYGPELRGKRGEINMRGGDEEFAGALRTALQDEKLRAADMEAFANKRIERSIAFLKNTEELMADSALASRLMQVGGRGSFTPQTEAPISPAGLRDWVMQEVMRIFESEAARVFHVDQVFAHVTRIASEVAAAKAQEELQKNEAQIAGAKETGGVRNSVLWTQRAAQLRAAEVAQLEKYNSWNPL